MSTVVVCRGKHCRKAGLDDRALRSLVGASREGAHPLVQVDCLAACDEAPVVAWVTGERARVFGHLDKDKHLLAVCDVVAGRTDTLPQRLVRREIVTSGKTEKRIARALKS